MNVSEIVAECIDIMENDDTLVKYAVLKDATIVEVEKSFDSGGKLLGYTHRAYKLPTGGIFVQP